MEGHHIEHVQDVMLQAGRESELAELLAEYL